MKRLLTFLAVLALSAHVWAQSPAEKTDDQSQLAPGVSIGVAFMCANTSDTIDSGDFGAIRCGSSRQLMVEAIQSGTWSMNVATIAAGDTNIGNVDVLTLPNVTVGTFPDNEPINVALMNGVAVTMGNGASGTGVQRVTLASDSTGQLAVASLPNEGQQTAANSISVTYDTDNDPVGATGAAPPGEVVDVGGRTSGADTTGLMTGITVCTDHAPINVSTATTTLLVTGVANRHVRVCSINLVTAAANNVTLIAGTGATCGTSTAAVIGGTTAAAGWNFAANGGLTLGGGLGEILSTKVTGGATGDSLCIVTSAATQLSGSIAYAIY